MRTQKHDGGKYDDGGATEGGVKVRRMRRTGGVRGEAAAGRF